MTNGSEQEAHAERLALAREAAERAGKITLKYFQTEFVRETKADGSVVTVADRQGEQQIRRMIQRKFPEDSVLGEEFEEKKGTSRYRWIIDPLDGTLSYATGVPLYGVLIGVEDLETRSCPVGVVHIPALAETVYAQRGQGCHWMSGSGRHRATRRAAVSSIDLLEKAVLLTTDLFNAPTDDRRQKLLRLASRARVCRTWADCYGYVLVATGRAELMIDSMVKIWDCAPMQPILQEAGGTFSDWAGKHHVYGDSGLATNGKLLKEALAALA